MPRNRLALRPLAIVCTTLLIALPLSRAVSQAQWWPSQGSVILGGGGLKEEVALGLVDSVIAWAGGPDALIVIIPSASDGLPPRLPSAEAEPKRIRDLRSAFEGRGARNVVFLHTRDRAVANSEDFVKILRSAKAVFMPGGATRVLDRTFHGTLVERELKALLARGGVLAGDSAGAIALGCFWLSYDNVAKSTQKITDGLCALPRVTVTPHVRAVDEEVQAKDVADWISTRPTTIGINLYENTVLLLRGGSARVLGTGFVTVLDLTKDKTKPYLRLATGVNRDLSR